MPEAARSLRRAAHHCCVRHRSDLGAWILHGQEHAYAGSVGVAL